MLADLELWKLSNPLLIHKEFKDVQFPNPELDDKATDDMVELLHPGAEVLDYWTEAPPKRCIHVVVCPSLTSCYIQLRRTSCLGMQSPGALLMITKK
jgi:hypothetical protein